MDEVDEDDDGGLVIVELGLERREAKLLVGKV